MNCDYTAQYKRDTLDSIGIQVSDIISKDNPNLELREQKEFTIPKELRDPLSSVLTEDVEQEIPINKSTLLSPLKEKRESKYWFSGKKVLNQKKNNKKRVVYPLSFITTKVSEVHLEGVLEKYHPGFSLFYIQRQCTLTHSYFEYYNTSVSYMKLPLLRLWISDIESVSKIKIRNTNNEIKLNEYHFEIIMKSEWSLERYCSVLDSINCKSLFTPKDKNKKISRNNLRVLVSCPEEAVSGHLMLRPSLLDRYISEKQRINIKDMKAEEKVYYVNGVKFKDKKEAKLFKEFVRKEEKMVGVRREEEITAKSPKKWINSLSGFHTWNNRSLEWYLAEERMLFSAKTEAECNRWVFILNWLLQNKEE